jgi:putative DNA primase/helicase
MADGAGKNRSQAKGGLRAKPSWALLYLSSGELTLAQHMEAAGEKQKAGQEVRLIPVPTEVKDGSALETFHEFNTGHEISSWVQGRAAKYYGTAGRAWLEHLVANTDTLSIDLRQRMDSIEAQLVPDGASGQVKRGVRRFALIAAAGEMATAAGLTGWEEHDATWAAQTCLDAWIASRGGAGNSELASILRQVRTFFEAHGDARFPYWHRIGDDHASKTINRAGLRRVFNVDGTPYKDIGNKAVDVPLGSVYEEGGTVIYYVLPEVFLGEVCKGIDIKAACELLKSSGCLLATEPGRYNVSTKLPGIGKVRCYCITDAIHSIDV